MLQNWRGLHNVGRLNCLAATSLLFEIELPAMSGAVSTGRCNTGLEFTSRRFKAQGLPWALIDAQGYFV
jgi:hypothetical protein